MAPPVVRKSTKCIVPNCKSGYASCKEKVSLFSCPNNKEIIQQWQKAIPRKDFIVESGHCVCQKHFSEDDIVWKKEVIGPDGKVMVSENLKKPHLKPGSIPRIFPNCPQYLTNPKTKRKSPKKRQVNIENKKSKKRKIEEVCSQETENGEEKNSCEPSSNINFDNNHSEEEGQNNMEIDPENDNKIKGEKERRSSLFNSMYEDKNILNIPLSWNRRSCKENGFGSIELSQVIHRKTNNRIDYVSYKKLIILDDMSFQIQMMGIPLNPNKIGVTTSYISSSDEVSQIVQELENSKICTGCASPTSERNVESSFALRDVEGRLRHLKCSIVMTDSDKTTKRSCCISCRNGKKVLGQKKVRMQNRKNYERITMKMSPTKAEKLKLLRQRLKKEKRSRVKFQRLYQDCRKELLNSQEEMKAFNDGKIEGLLSKFNINKKEQTVICEIIKNSKLENDRSRRYAEDWILLCLLFHMRSPAAYRLLRENKVLPLPCTSTIRRYLSLMDAPCGFDDKFLKLFEESLKKRPDIYCHGLLSIDEMATRKNIRVDPKTMKMTGLTDHGDNEQADINDIADHGMVFMFQPLKGSFTQPIGVFVNKGPASGDILSKLIVQAISVLEKAGAKIHGIITDGATTNRNFWTNMGVCGRRNNVRSSFPHPIDENREVFVFSDTPHLIKCVRNRLYEKNELKVHNEGDAVKWDYFQKLYDVDKKNVTGRWCPKITPQHLEVNNLLKMRVSLAVQIFSKCMASGLLKARHHFPDLFKGCERTAEFCLRINNVFDALNRNENHGLTPDCPDFTVLKDFLVWLDEWESLIDERKLTRVDCLTTSTSEGLRVTITSVINLSTVLFERYNFSEVLTGLINQDPLERFFGTVRMAGGTNDHPCTPTFLQIYKLLSAFSILKPPKLGNCSLNNPNAPQFLITLSQLKEIYKNNKTSGFEQIKSKLKIIAEDDNGDFCDFVNAVEHDYAMPELMDCLLFFTTESVCRHIRKRVKCKNCLKVFLSTSDAAKDQLLFSTGQMPRSFEKFVNPNRELIHPNQRMFKLIIKIESLFQKYCKLRNAFDLILDEFTLSETKLNFECKEHESEAVDILAFIIKFYLQIRLREFLKKELTDLKMSKSQIKKKAAKLCKT